MNRKSSFDIFDYIPACMITVFGIMFAVAVVVGATKVIVTQSTLNQECKTNYTFLQVAFAGDNLARLCQIKNQQITSK